MSHAPAGAEPERRTTFLELFFDLVLVFAVTQLAGMLHDVPHHHGDHLVLGTAEVALFAAMMWWLWSQFAWLGTSARLSAVGPRITMLSLTGALLLAAVLLPGAAAPGVAGFGLAYAVVKLGALGLFAVDASAAPNAEAHAAAVRSYVGKASVAPLIVLGASFLDPGPRLALWGVALAIEIGSALLAGGGAFQVSPSHFVERHALVLIVLLGEAVVALGGKVVLADLGPVAAAGVLGGFALVAVLWWSYFGWVAEAAEGWMHARARRTDDRAALGRLARDVFTFGHFPLVAGLIAVAVALKDLAAAPLEPWGLSARVAMAAGLALYLGGFVAFARRGGEPVLVERVAALVLSVPLILLLPLPAGALAGLLAGVLAGALGLEARRRARVASPS